MKLHMKFRGRTADGKGYVWVSEEQFPDLHRMMYVCNIDWYWKK